RRAVDLHRDARHPLVGLVLTIFVAELETVEEAVALEAEVDLGIGLLVRGRLADDIAAPAGVVARRSDRGIARAPAAVEREQRGVAEHVSVGGIGIGQGPGRPRSAGE